MFTVFCLTRTECCRVIAQKQLVKEYSLMSEICLLSADPYNIVAYGPICKTAYDMLSCIYDVSL